MSGLWKAVALGWLALAGAPAAQAAEAPAKRTGCQLQMTAELPVTFEDNEPLVDAHVDGRPLRVLFDTGASRTALMRGTARSLGILPLGREGQQAIGADGFTTVADARLRDLELSGVHFTNFAVDVVGDARPGPEGMLMGRDFLGRVDVEFDLGHKTIRLLKPKNCKSDQMVYWAPTYSQAPLRQSYLGGPYLVDVELNGHTIHALLDSGASVSVASRQAAARAGVSLRSTGEKTQGIAGRAMDQAIAELDSFRVGDETIRRTQLRVADLFSGVEQTALGSRIAQRFDDLPQMLLGADFLKSHRVLVSPTQRMIYFTYEGGAVFDTAHRPSPPPGAEGAATASPNPRAAPSPQAASRPPAGS